MHLPSNVAGRLLEQQPLQTGCRDQERDRAQDQQVGQIEHGPGGDRETKRGHDDDEAERVKRSAEQGPCDLAERDIGDAERRGQHSVVELHVLQLVEEIERGFVDRAVHGGGRHHRRGDEYRVAKRVTVDDDARTHQRADSEADREQVEQRLHEAREDDGPAAPLHDRIALDEVRRAVGCRQLEGPPPRQHRNHWTSRRCKVMRAATMPIAAYRSKTARWTNADGPSTPSERPRASATPCASGVSQAMPWRSWGSWWSGKKTPPSKNRGVITKRPIRAKLWSVRRLAVQARIGAANASPVSTAAPIASTASTEWIVPKASMTRKNAPLPSANRNASQPNSPARTSRTAIGVASMPS